MVDLEPFLEAPFEEASNRSFELLLALGCVLLVTVAVLGRSPVTMAIVAGYLLSIPAYVAYRIRVWDGAAESEESNGSTAESATDDAETQPAERQADRSGADTESNT